MTLLEDWRLASQADGPTSRWRHQQVKLMGCAFDSVTETEAVAQCLQWCKQRRRPRMIIPVNAAILMMMRRIPALREVCTRRDLVLADGMPIVWAARLLGTPLPGRVTGVDLMARLLAVCAQEGLRVFLLGATQEVVTRLVEVVQQRHPALAVAGYRNGYFSEDEYPQVAFQVRTSRADVLFVGMPSPFKETWCHQRREELATPVIFCAGGSFDVLAGDKRRAPRWMQQAGLEWSWRLWTEPRRLWRRYLVNNLLFLCVLARALVSRPWKRRTRDATEGAL